MTTRRVSEAESLDSSIGQDNLPSPDSAGSSLSLQLMKRDKLCLVCGDKALGYNFNAVSCESCKAFFRRNAHKTIRGRCEGKCDVNMESRSFCKRCRLTKCFTVGMRKDMILNDDQKRMRKQKIIINKLRRHGSLPPEDTYSISEAEIKQTFEHTMKDQQVEDMNQLFPNMSEEEIATLKKMKLEAGLGMDTPMSANVKEQKEKTKYKSWAESGEIVEKVISDLDEADRLVLCEMNKAHESSNFLANTQTQLKNLPSNPTEMFNIAEGFVRRIIKVAKQLEFFRNLGKDDQISLLKGSVVEIMMLRSAINFDVQTETWSLSTSSCINTNASPSSPTQAASAAQKGQTEAAGNTGSSLPLNLSQSFPGIPPNMSIEQLRELGKKMGFTRENVPNTQDEAGKTGSVSKMQISSNLLKMGNSETRTMFLTYSKFIKALMTTIFGDMIVLKFLIMLSLFSPDRPGVEDRALIEKYQEVYATVFQKYISQRFPEEKTMFAKCLMKLTDLRNVNEVHTKMLLKMQVEDIEPLLLEIFDL